MRLLIGTRDFSAGLSATNYVAAKRLIREHPVSLLQIMHPDPSRESLVGFLSWCNGKHVLPSTVRINQVSVNERQMAMQYLLARGYRTNDRVNFFKQ